MKSVDQREKTFWDGFDKSASEAKKDLEKIQKDLKRKHDGAERTMDKVRDKCRNQFETQNNIYKKYEEIGEGRVFNSSEKVYNKYNLTQ